MVIIIAYLLISRFVVLALCQVDIPAFLESISPDAQEELDEIVSDGEQTKHQMNEKLDDWAQRQPPGFANNYFALKQSLMEAKQTLETAKTRTLVNQPLEVQNAEQRIEAIQNNQEISRNEERRQISAVINQLSHEAQKIINAKTLL
ncbi:hypothetical protein DdX_00453 [Ditylenchus destructor]|uniref:SXP/RAL-2 family protein Ani s 5-like cation-binding domain-containing protein n=1 Tax=Ditylenchus destructor TaxID=166010 RepID=A0AAD4RD82_9BILA|nr:hypothetical protein DdX_00453 [Ditylenchus destructor]